MNFLKNLKNEILKSAKEAVFEAERIFGNGNGTAKKQAAIAFVTNALKLPPILREIVAILLGAFIDASIETAVTLLKSEETTFSKTQLSNSVEVHDEENI